MLSVAFSIVMLSVIVLSVVAPNIKLTRKDVSKNILAYFAGASKMTKKSFIIGPRKLHYKKYGLN
jgi:hypothetical protein